MHRIAAAALSAAAVWGAWAGAADAQQRREFRSWEAVCDNVRTCTAYTWGNIDNAGFVRIERAAGPNAQPTLALGFFQSGDDAAAGPIALLVDGREVARATRSGDLGSDSYAAGSVAPGQVRGAIEALKNGARVQLRVGRETHTLSGSGAAASLLWMDEVQGRVGGVTALARRGSRPASAVPPAPAPPVVRRTVLRELSGPLPASVRRNARVAECIESRPDFQTAEERSYDLGGGARLWAIDCGTGAYNVPSIFVRVDRSGRVSAPLTFRSALAAEPEVEDSLYNWTYENGLLTAFYKGRGIGDCGQETQWVWTGNRFALVRERRMDVCGMIPSDYWPSFYVATVR